MKYCYTLLVIVFLFPLFSNAQSNYKPGYLVSIKGDTLKGYIDRKEWGNNPTQFSFKTNANSKAVIKYDINNSAAFGINGAENYKRSIVQVTNDRIEMSRLSVGADTVTTRDTLFLRTITAGKNITLFVYQDNIKERFFVAEGNGTAVELSYHVFLDPEQTSKILYTTSYKRQLQRWAVIYQPGNRALLNETQRTEYSLKPLIKVVNELNGDQLKNLETKDERAGYAFFAGIGIKDEVTSIDGNVIFANGKKLSSIFPKIDVGIDLYANKNVKKLVFRADLCVTGSKTNIVAQGMATTKYIQTLKFDRYMATLNPQIIFNAYNSDNLRFYLGAGPAATYNIYTNKETGIKFYSGQDLISEANTEFPDMKSLMLGLAAKLGSVIGNKFEIYAGYNSSTLNQNIVYSINSATYQAGIHYFFGNK